MNNHIATLATLATASSYIPHDPVLYLKKDNRNEIGIDVEMWLRPRRTS